MPFFLAQDWYIIKVNFYAYVTSLNAIGCALDGSLVRLCSLYDKGLRHLLPMYTKTPSKRWGFVL